MPPKTILIERSWSVLSISTLFARRPRICCIPILKEAIIVGIDFIRVINPAVATAPAPMYLIYFSHIILAIFKSVTGSPSS